MFENGNETLGPLVYEEKPTAQFGDRRAKFTELGGVAVLLKNRTGAASVKGLVVRASPDEPDAVVLTPTVEAGLYSPIGVIYESGVPDGGLMWVVVSGIAHIYCIEGFAVELGDALRTSSTTSGRAGAFNPNPSDAEHFREVGHTLEAKTTGDANRLVKAVLHFN